MEDLLTEPEHTPILAVGGRLEWTAGGEATRRLLAEYGSTALSNARNLESVSAYRHQEALHGYTHRGQMLGASFGPGARGVFLSVSEATAARTIELFAEHLLHDVDVHRLVLGQREGRAGRDRELRAGVGISGAVSIVPGLVGDVTVGYASRWNRHYRRFHPDLAPVTGRESNAWIDLTWSWTPERR